jgi:hypothetical protein
MFLDRVRELVSGSGGDRLISADELASGGLTGSLVAPSGSTGLSYLAAPPAPANVSATAAVRTIFVEWDAPAYAGHAYAEVWGASTNSLAAAVLLGMSPGSIYVDETGPSATRYYWVRFVNTDDVKGPYNATSGATATTGPEVTYLLSTLTGSITESQLFTDLGSRINLIDGAASVAGSVNARVAAEAEARGAAILTEAEIRDDADTALAGQITALTATVDGNTAAITTEVSTRAAADTALAGQITTLSSTVDGNTAAITAEVTTRASETGSLFAQYTVKVDVNGYVSGFGLASQTVDGVPVSDFQVRADRFSITNPSTTLVAVSTLTRSSTTATLTTSSAHGLSVGDTITLRGVTNDTNWNGAYTVLTAPSTTQITFAVANTRTTPATGTMRVGKTAIPFIVDGGAVYIASAMIKDATITNAKIGNLAVDDAKIASLSVGKLTAGSIAADQYIQSSNYVAGTSGFRLDANGNAYLQNAVVRGTVYATAGTFAGSLSAATGTFAGSLSAATGTFSGTLTASAINAVNTINIAGNAVTVPNVVTLAAGRAGYTFLGGAANVFSSIGTFYPNQVPTATSILVSAYLNDAYMQFNYDASLGHSFLRAKIVRLHYDATPTLLTTYTFDSRGEITITSNGETIATIDFGPGKHIVPNQTTLDHHTRVFSVVDSIAKPTAGPWVYYLNICRPSVAPDVFCYIAYGNANSFCLAVKR